MKPLTKMEVIVLTLKQSGKNFQEIGDECMCSREWARTIWRRGKQRLHGMAKIEYLLACARFIDAAEVDIRATLYPWQVCNLFEYFDHDMRLVLQAESGYIANRVVGMGPKAVGKLEDCLRPYGLRLDMSEGEIAAVDSRAVGGVP